MTWTTVRRDVSGAVCAVAATFALVSVAAQGQRPVFRADIELVELDVVATNRHGDTVQGLGRDDFEVFEDGEPVEIASFDAVHLPDSVPVAPDRSPDLSGTALSSNGRSLEGRIIVIVLHGLSFSSGQFHRAKETVRALVDRLGPTDQVAMFSTTGARDYRVEFTTDRLHVLRALERPPSSVSGGLAACAQQTHSRAELLFRRKPAACG